MKRPERWLLGTVVAVSTGFSLAYSRLTPLGQAPDEAAHLANVIRLAHHLQLPPLNVPEHKQPPLFYLLGAGVYRVSGDPRAVRLVATVLGIATLLVIHALARRLFPGRRLVPVGATALFALLPEMQYLSGAASDESVAWLSGALVLLCTVVALLRPRLDTRFIALSGVVSGVAILSKETVWVLVAILAVVIVVRQRRCIRVLDAAAYLVPLAVLSGWWFARNLVAFHTLTPSLFNILGPPQYLHSVSQARGFLAATFDSTLGNYGNGQKLETLEVFGRRPVPSLLIGAAIAAATAVFVAALLRFAGTWDSARRVASVLAVAVAAVIAQYVANSVTVDLQPQARYLMVTAAVFASAFAWSVARLFPKPAIAAGAGVAVAVALLLDVSGLITASRLPGS